MNNETRRVQDAASPKPPTPELSPGVIQRNVNEPSRNGKRTPSPSRSCDLSSRGEAQRNGHTPEPKLLIKRLSEYQPETIEWLWARRIPVGKITLMVGDPGEGKSYGTTAIAADFSNGRAPAGIGPAPSGPLESLFACYEDGIADTIRPRADSLGAKVQRIHIIEGERFSANGKEQIRPFCATHVDELDRYLEANPAIKILVIDPLANFIGGRVNSSRNNEVRSVLWPLKELAERRKIAVVLVLHMRKEEAEKILYRVADSIAFVGVARMVLLVSKNAESGRRSFAPMKHNIAGKAQPVEFTIDDETGEFTWGAEAPDLTAEAQIKSNTATTPKRGRDEVKTWLEQTALAKGPRDVASLYADANILGYSQSRVRRAADDLGVQKNPSSFQGHWIWSLSDDTP